MLSRKSIWIVVPLVMALAACIPTPTAAIPTPTNTVPAAVTPSATPAPATATTAPAATTAAPAATTAAPTNTTGAPATATATTGTPGGPVTPPSDYIDSRSDGVAVLTSYFNAINRHEYARAYGYWEDPATAGDFASFMAGYANTASVEMTTGPLGGDAGAGQFYYTVAVTLHAAQTDGTTQIFAGCYTLHVSNPGIQGAPPFRPLGIRTAAISAVSSDAAAASAMAAACPSGQVITPQPTPGPTDIGTSVYIDDRSGPVEVLRSLFNAVNRHEYVRAYWYWEDNSTVSPFPAFEAGYSATQVVTLTTGTVTSDPGAGQIYYSVPVTLKSQITGGAVQIFAGCYTLHISNPGIQTDPPFHPLAIRDAHLQMVADDAAAAAIMAQPCAP